MAVPSVFISSVIRGLEDVREAAARAIERLGMHPIMAERLSADPAAPRRALLDEVASSDYYLLILGPRYGEVGNGNRSPTEEEYEEAVRRHRPILVLVQEVELEPEQRDFLERVRGSWGEGVLYDTFQGPEDIGEVVAAALARRRAGIFEDPTGAASRAVDLARGEERGGASTGGVDARIAYVPLRDTVLLDAVALEDHSLGDVLAAFARDTGLVPQRIGINSGVSAAGVTLVGTEDDDWTKPEMRVGADGAIVVTGSVRGSGHLGGSLVDSGRFDRLLHSAGDFAQLAWNHIDVGGEVERVAVSVAIPDAQYKGFGSISGGSMSMGSGLPATVVAEPAEIVPRGQVGDDDVVRRRTAAVRRVFADAGAIHGE